MPTWWYLWDEIREKTKRLLLRFDLIPGWDYIQCEVGHDYGHAFPTKDRIIHTFDDEGNCACTPLCEPVPRDDDSIGWFYLHRAMDGRREI